MIINLQYTHLERKIKSKISFNDTVKWYPDDTFAFFPVTS